MKEFLKWLHAGLGSLAVLVMQLAASGTHPTAVDFLKLVGGAALVRAAGWVIQHFGPAPTR